MFCTHLCKLSYCWCIEYILFFIMYACKQKTMFLSIHHYLLRVLLVNFQQVSLSIKIEGVLVSLALWSWEACYLVPISSFCWFRCSERAMMLQWMKVELKLPITATIICGSHLGLECLVLVFQLFQHGCAEMVLHCCAVKALWLLTVCRRYIIIIPIYRISCYLHEMCCFYRILKDPLHSPSLLKLSEGKISHLLTTSHLIS